MFYKGEIIMQIFYSPIDITKCNIFEEIKDLESIFRVKSTKKMKKGDLVLLHLGKQDKNYPSGVYAYGKIVKEPYLLTDEPNDFCNNMDVVDLKILKINESPFMFSEETDKFIQPYQTPHIIDKIYYNEIFNKIDLEDINTHTGGRENDEVFIIDSDAIINNKNRRVWKVQPGNKNVVEKGWEIFKEDEYVAINFTYDDKDVDFSQFKNKTQIKQFIAEKDPNLKKIVSHNFIWNFVKEMKEGDIVIANLGQSKVAGIGIITSDFIPQTKHDYENELGLRNIRKVKWISDIPIDMGKYFFLQNTVEEISNQKWNMIVCSLARENKDIRLRLLDYLYDSFKDKYLPSERGKNHKKEYHMEKEWIDLEWNNILFKKENNEDYVDYFWDKIIDRDIRVHRDPITKIKLYLSSKEDYDLNSSGKLLFETFDNLKNETDYRKQELIISEFAEKDESKYIGAGRFSSILYYLNDSFYVINNKLVDTINLLSYLLPDKVEVNTNLEDYFENNDKYHKFLDDLYDSYLYSEFDITDFKTFDMFCNWMCDKDLGNFASENANKIPFDEIWDIKEIVDDEGDYLKGKGIVMKKVNLSERILKKEFEDFCYSPKTINQLCAALNAGKHVILDGTPGTGKTDIAIRLSKVAEQHYFTNGFVLTTATSDWSTFDTIGGLMPGEGMKLYFHPGKFLEAIAENKWLIIDEINRADIDKAFGQLFTVLSKQDVELQYKENGKPIKIVQWDKNFCEHDENNAIYRIGKNWRIIGTMNVDDKDSLYDLSYAFMRRFMFIEVDLPEEDQYINLINDWAEILPEGYKEKIIDLYAIIKFRPLGPAIFKDIIEYISYRDELRDEGENENDILAEAVSSYIIPQLEGLNQKNIEGIKEILKILESDVLLKQLDDLSLGF